MTYSLAGEHISLSQIGVRVPSTSPAVGSIIYVPAAGGGWEELVISVPVANVRNALAIDNGETVPSYKTTLDATTPAAVDAAGSPGTSLIYSHRDHVHPQDTAVTGIDFLVGTATGELSAEIVVGTAPGGELGGTWASPTLDSIEHDRHLGLTDDDHTQYALLAGRSGGQTLIGDTAASGLLKLQSTASATRGTVRVIDNMVVGSDIGLIGTPTTNFEVAKDAVANIGLRSATTNPSPGFRGISSRGSLASPTAIQNGDILFFAGGHGYDGSAFSASANIIMLMTATENWSTTAKGNQISLESVTNVTATRNQNLIIGEAGARRIHVIPSGTADVQLEVSDGATTGGGTIHRATSTTHSSRKIKSDINYLLPGDAQQGLADVLVLKHATFRYMRNVHGTKLDEGGNEVEDASVVIGRVRDESLPLYRGLIYEDAPNSIRASHETISIDDRITNLELAVQTLASRP